MSQLSCKLFGHRYVIHEKGVEKPYPGPYRDKGKTPHTRIITMVFCDKCGDMQTLNNYLFDHDEEK
jgi:hypothetical protein